MNDLFEQEWMQILRSLEQHHSLFYRIWEIGKPVFTSDVDTAAVKFDKQGNFVIFIFNPDFWSSLDFYTKLFVVSHECLHLLLNHGVRIKDSPYVLACNQCLDVVVNHLLVNKFGFQREKIQNQGSYCWIDTVFPDNDVSDKESFEHYYNLFVKSYGDGSGASDVKTVDDHNELANFDNMLPIKEAATGLSKYEKESLEFLDSQPGIEDGIKWAILSAGTSTKKKQKWETVIKRWSSDSKKLLFKDKEQWTHVDRRLSSLPTNLFLPSDFEVEGSDKKLIKVSFFLDSSGSCWDLKDRFFAAATTLNTDFFDVELFCFDTKVYRVSLEEKKIFGGGGTSFSKIEEFLRTNGNYPDGVFVITDGYGDKVFPIFPKRWHWFLLNESKISLLPKESNIHVLSDFE